MYAPDLELLSLFCSHQLQQKNIQISVRRKQQGYDWKRDDSTNYLYTCHKLCQRSLRPLSVVSLTRAFEFP